MPMRGIRGATTVANNNKQEIISATKELLLQIVMTNQIDITDIASVIFTTTADLNAEFPAAAAREIGWTDTALLCSKEIDVPGSLPLCIRILILLNSDKKQKEIRNVYLKGATNLR